MTAKIVYGGFWVRLLASLLDSIILAAVIAPILFCAYGFDPVKLLAGNMNSWANFALTWVFPCIAVILFWHYKSATPGKMIFDLVIVDANTLSKPTNKQLIIRYFAYFVSTIPFCLGFLWIAFDKRKQGWHDKIAKTVVIIKPC
ncbi:MAG: RDD family protein [Gammaproteobacteria bacterium]|nr:RDD family protein [Gammaproteobacteria bacterium]